MKKLLPTLLAAALLTAWSGCGNAPEVLQGKVVSYDGSTHMLVVQDERAPERLVTLSLEKAEIGALPQANDIVRAAYREAGGSAVATRLMNLTRQQEVGTHPK